MLRTLEMRVLDDAWSSEESLVWRGRNGDWGTEGATRVNQGLGRTAGPVAARAACRELSTRLGR